MASTHALKRTKFIPTIKVDCGEYVVEGPDGGKYYPHANEYVLFRKSVKLSVIRKLGDIQAFQAELRETSQGGRENETLAADDTAQSISLIGELIGLVFGQIEDWTLTSNEVDEDATAKAREEESDAFTIYKPYPSPKTHRSLALEAMWDFDLDFLQFLQSHMMDGANAPNA